MIDSNDQSIKSIAWDQDRKKIFKAGNLLSDLIKRKLSLDTQQEYRYSWRRMKYRDHESIKVLNVIPLKNDKK